MAENEGPESQTIEEERDTTRGPMDLTTPLYDENGERIPTPEEEATAEEQARQALEDAGERAGTNRSVVEESGLAPLREPFEDARDDESGESREAPSQTEETTAEADDSLSGGFQQRAAGDGPPPISDELEGRPDIGAGLTGDFGGVTVPDTSSPIDPRTGLPRQRQNVPRRYQAEAEGPGFLKMLTLLFSHIFALFDSGKRDHAIMALDALFPPNKRSTDPAIEARYQRVIKAGDNPDDPLRDMTGRELAEELGLKDVLNQRSLLRPDLVAATTGSSAEAVRKRGILEDIVGAVETYNKTATVKLDPYVHANQLFQESERFKENPNNTLDSSVIGFAQMKLETANNFLRNNPEAQAAIGKTSVTRADLENRDIATTLSVHLMGYYTEKYGSQVAALFAYNGGEGAIDRVAENLGLDRDPTVNEVMQFYQTDRNNVDRRYESGAYDDHAEGAERRWASTWAVESFEYAILAYSPAWPIMPTLENPRFFSKSSPFTAADATTKMQSAGIPLPVEADPQVAVSTPVPR